MLRNIARKAANWDLERHTWRTNRKILVIQSDYWGSIRMPSSRVAKTLIKTNPKIAKSPHGGFDTLANANDLTSLPSLFNKLSQFKDKNGRHNVITANTIVANPEFKKIKNSGFGAYHYKPFYEALEGQASGKKNDNEHTSSF